jgi:type I restriction enzyme R subunit
MTKENQIEDNLIKQLKELKYIHRPDIVDRKTLEQNFKAKFEALNRVRLTDSEFLRLREEIINPDVFLASKFLRERQYFQREDGTPLHYTLVNIKDWCKNEYEVVSQLRINTENSLQRYDIILLINGLPVVQIELKKLDISPRKAMQQIVDYKNEPGNGYGNSLMCFMQLFIVSNRSNTYYFANNKNIHFQFNADEQFLPIYQLADESNKKITHLDLFAEKFLKNTETLVRRLLSTDYADKVIVTTIQKLGLALDGTYKRNFKERLEPLSKKRVVFIFDECHRSQFGENHKAIKEFFPNAQLFGFTGTPIFDENATYKIREDQYETYKTTEAIFEKQLHAYTITHAIDDKNVLRFHMDYFKGKGNQNPKPGEAIAQQAVAEAIIDKHNVATNQRKFNALLATASINNAIEYYRLFKELQKKKLALSEAEGQEENPEEKKKALTEIIADYNKQFGTNHSVNEFDLYYQDLQRRIKDQKFSNKDYPHKNKVDITIVVDMLLTGFDSKFLNTLYVDKNLKHHGLIQTLSRTNRVLNDTKPYGNILDFRSQQEAVNQAITLFSGEDSDKASEIWMVDPAPVVIDQYQKAVEALGEFMQEHNLVNEPQGVYNLRGDAAKITFVKNFKEVQRLKTQLDQYTDLDEEGQNKIESILPKEKLQEFRSSYIETAKQLREIQQKEGEDAPEEIQQLDFEFVLFASAVIDYDYIMNLIADSTQQKPAKQKMTKAQVISLLKSNSNLMDEEDDLTDYINSLDWNSGQDADKLRKGYENFKIEKLPINTVYKQQT